MLPVQTLQYCRGTTYEVFGGFPLLGSFGTGSRPEPGIPTEDFKFDPKIEFYIKFYPDMLPNMVLKRLSGRFRMFCSSFGTYRRNRIGIG